MQNINKIPQPCHKTYQLYSIFISKPCKIFKFICFISKCIKQINKFSKFYSLFKVLLWICILATIEEKIQVHKTEPSSVMKSVSVHAQEKVN